MTAQAVGQVMGVDLILQTLQESKEYIAQLTNEELDDDQADRA
jgi:hypothetical protein